MMANLKVISFLSFALILSYSQSVSAFDYENYFKKSILTHLEEKQGSFISGLVVYEFDRKISYEVKEAYSFSQNAGEFVGIEYFDGEKHVNKVVYFNDLKEMHTVDEIKHNCHLMPIDEGIVDFYTTSWCPRAFIVDKEHRKILGPNFVLFNILSIYKKDKSKISCEHVDEKLTNNKKQTKCTIVMETHKLEYLFQDYVDHTMIPISILHSELITDNWTKVKKFDYYKFETSLLKIIDPISLPIGYGCEPITLASKDFVDFHGIHAKDFNMSISYEYINYLDNKTVVVDELNIYAIDWNSKTTLIVSEGIDLATKKKVKTYYNTRTGVSYACGDDGCQRFDSKIHKDHIAYSKVQELMVHHPEFFFANKNEFVCLGKQSVYEDGAVVEYYVFEKVFKTVKDIDSHTVIVDHYYATSDLHAPKKIEFRFRDEDEENVGYLVVYVNSFSEECDKTVFDFSSHLKDDVHHDEVTIKFETENLEFLKRLKETEIHQIEEKLRSLIKFINPVRIADIKAKKEEKSVDVVVDIVGIQDAENYFEVVEDKGLSEEVNCKVYEEVSDEKTCAKMCAEVKDCLSFAFKEHTCKLVIEEGFDEHFCTYDWTKLVTVDDKGSKVGKRVVQFSFEQDSSTESFISYIKELIKSKKIIIDVEEKEENNEVHHIDFAAYDVLIAESIKEEGKKAEEKKIKEEKEHVEEKKKVEKIDKHEERKKIREERRKLKIKYQQERKKLQEELAKLKTERKELEKLRIKLIKQSKKIAEEKKVLVEEKTKIEEKKVTVKVNHKQLEECIILFNEMVVAYKKE